MRLNIVKLLLSIPPGQCGDQLSFLAGKGAVFEQRLFEVCCAEPVCGPDTCVRQPDCPFPGLAARMPSPDADLLKRHQKPGLPFVFTPCAEKNCCSLVLLGSAIPHLLLILKVLGVFPGPGAGSAVKAFDYQDIPVVLSCHPNGAIENLPILASAELIDLASSRFQHCSRITIDLLTPLRLVRDGHELIRFDPVFFIRSLLRRLSSLAAYYGEGLDADLFRHLAELAGEVELARRTPATVQPRGRGISGRYELSGPFDELGPILSLGALVHLGKGASYGLGTFEIRPIS